ncbi:MAG: AAA family ATPase [Epsilonproteobacteria bacterium]|nr:AAA family ATPase [Campylobacterota bacterium]
MTESKSNLINALQKNPSIFPHPVESLSLVETHISWILLTGPYAYKIKKPVNFGFLDFSTLEKRRFYCEEELRLNKRLAPNLYIELIKITGNTDKPEIDREGHAIEYAVKMVQFPQSAQLDRVLSNGKLTNTHIDLIAKKVAEFHAKCNLSHKNSSFGKPDVIRLPVIENFEQIRQQSIIKEDLNVLQEIQNWSEKSFLKLQADFEKRNENGFIRECHGDMHLRNIALIDKQIIMFDCLEFNEALRWIDVMSELAFLCMDLDDRNKQEFSRRLLNGYLELTGDYEGVTVLGFYQVYRAMVRAKVGALRLPQPGLNENEKLDIISDFQGYLQLARKYTQQNKPVLFITHGLSGSGKTTGTQSLVEELGAIRIRSDIERKRLYDVPFKTREPEEVGEGIYSQDAGVKTYDRLINLSESLLLAGRCVVVDATFLKRRDRNFSTLAKKLGIPFYILSFQAPEPVLKERIIKRQNINEDASDAGISVLENQLKNIDQLDAAELEFSITIEYNSLLNIEKIKSDLYNTYPVYVSQSIKDLSLEIDKTLLQQTNN